MFRLVFLKVFSKRDQVNQPHESDWRSFMLELIFCSIDTSSLSLCNVFLMSCGFKGAVSKANQKAIFDSFAFVTLENDLKTLWID